MGTSSSRRMDNVDEASLVTGADPDADIAQLLQYLIQSGQVHIIASDRDDSSDEELRAPLSPPKVPQNPDTQVLDQSAFKLMTISASGSGDRRGNYARPKSITKMLCARERGLAGSGSLTRGDRCRLMNNFLPNKLEHVLSYHSKIFCGTFSQDGSMFLTASQDKKLRLYDTKQGKFRPLRTITGRGVGWSILDTAFSPDGYYVAYSSWSESLHLCPLLDESKDQQMLLMSPFDRRFCIFSLRFSSDGNEILCGANDGCIYIYDRGCDQRVLRIPSHDDDVNSVAFADDTSQIVYSGGDDGIVKVWDRRTLSESDPVPVGMLAGHMDGITFIEPRGDGRHLLSNSKDQSIKLWDVRVFSSAEALLHTKTAVEHQSWDYRWQGIPKALKNPMKRVPGDTSVMTYCGHSVLQTLCRCHFSPQLTTGQKYIYTGCASGSVIVYDALTGKMAKTLRGHRGCVRDVAWHPYRPELVSTSWDGNVLKWTYSEDVEEIEEDLKRGTSASSSGGVRRSQRLRDKMIAASKERMKREGSLVT